MEGLNTEDLSSKSSAASRPRVEAKFLYVGNEKFWVKGATYGAFAPNSLGHQFPEPPECARDFSLMRAAGINTILTYTVPPISMLDQAWDHVARLSNACMIHMRGHRNVFRFEARGPGDRLITDAGIKTVRRVRLQHFRRENDWRSTRQQERRFGERVEECTARAARPYGFGHDE